MKNAGRKENLKGRDGVRPDYKVLFLGLLSLVTLTIAAYAAGFIRAEVVISARPANTQPAPHSARIKGIVGNLRYSGLQMFKRKDVNLSLDFRNRLWRLSNVHKFDDAGDLVLEEGRYGTCGELAAYTYKAVLPLLGGGYNIDFVKSVQSGFFLAPTASHIVLRITSPGSLSKRRAPEVYILDPSFRRYGHISEFEDYLFLERMPELPFLKEKESGVELPVNTLVPLLIKKEYLLGMAVEDINGKFDPQNYTVALTLTKKHNFAGRYLFAIRSFDGRQETFENRELARPLLDDKEFETLRKRVAELFEGTAKT